MEKFTAFIDPVVGNYAVISPAGDVVCKTFSASAAEVLRDSLNEAGNLTAIDWSFLNSKAADERRVAA